MLAWRKFHDLREPERLRAWLAQIARNAALGHLRRRRDYESLEEAPILTDESPTPDEAAANEEESALVRNSLAKLPETYRLPLILFYREGKSVAAVAEALGISEDAASAILSARDIGVLAIPIGFVVGSFQLVEDDPIGLHQNVADIEQERPGH